MMKLTLYFVDFEKIGNISLMSIEKGAFFWHEIIVCLLIERICLKVGQTYNQ